MLRPVSEIPPPYRHDLEGVLCFADFPGAENTIRRLDRLFRTYMSAGDRQGVYFCRQVALTGRRRAEAISRNQRVAMEKRLQKREIAAWFRVWLETPDLFDHWLELRKRAPEFRQMFAKDGIDANDPGSN
jgi:hypothetical protein